MLPELIGTDAEGNGNALPESAEPRSIHAPRTLVIDDKSAAELPPCMLIIDDKSAAELPSVPLNTTERAELAQRRAERRGPRR